MNQRLQNVERNNIRTRHKDDELFRVIDELGIELETGMPNFDMCPEEMYIEVIRVLTLIAEEGEDFEGEERLWHTLFNEYRRFDRSVPEDELKEAVCIVFLFAVVTLDTSIHTFYRYRITERLTEVALSHKSEHWSEISDRIFEAYVSDGWFDSFVAQGVEAELKNETKRNHMAALAFALAARRRYQFPSIHAFVEYAFNQYDEFKNSGYSLESYEGAVNDFLQKAANLFLQQIQDQSSMLEFIASCYVPTKNGKPSKQCVDMQKKAQFYFEQLA